MIRWAHLRDRRQPRPAMQPNPSDISDPRPTNEFVIGLSAALGGHVCVGDAPRLLFAVLYGARIKQRTFDSVPLIASLIH
jgi:hypothetical protein